MKIDGHDGEFSVKVGYYIDNEGYINVNIRPKTYCFFPTDKKLHMCFVCHAPFLLTNNRAGIKDDEVNTAFFNEIAKLASESLVCLKDIGEKDGKMLLNDNLFAIIRHNEEIEDWLSEKFIDIIKSNKLLLSRNKQYLSVDEALRGDSEDIEILLNVEQLNNIYGKDENQKHDFIYNKKDRRKDIDENDLQRLGVKTYDAKTLIKQLTKEFLKTQDAEWINRLYNYLYKHAKQYWGKVERGAYAQQTLILRTAPFIKLTNGEWASPYSQEYYTSPQVFIPIADNEQFKSESFKFVDKSLYESNKSFLEELGLKQPDISDYIKQDICSKYLKIKSADDITDKEAIADFDQLYTIWKNNGDDVRQKVKDLVRSCYKVRIKNSDNYVSFSDVLDGNDNQRAFYDDEKQFIDYSFYTTSKIEFDIKTIREFFGKLGIETGLLISRFRNTVWSSRFKDNEGKNYRIECYMTINDDYKIDGYDISTLNRKKSHTLWSFLCSSGFELEKYNTACFYGRAKYARFDSTFYGDSSIIHSLKNDPWICDMDGNLCKACDITKKEFLSLGYEQNEKLLNLLSFKIETCYTPIVEVRHKTLAELGATKEQQQNEEIGKRFSEKGYSIDDWDDFEAWKNEKQKKTDEAVKKTYGNINDTNYPDKNAQPVNVENFEDYFGGLINSIGGNLDNANNSESSTNPKLPRLKNRNVDLESYTKCQEEKLANEYNKASALEKMEEYNEYEKGWFLEGLRYEYLNSNESGKDKIDRSISISFTKVKVENESVFRFSEGTKIIPRWLEEIDGDIKMILELKDGQEIPISFAMASVQDFSLRLRAYGSDEKSLARLDLENNLRKATLDVNNPKGLVRNLYEAFGHLPYGNDYNMRDNIRKNVKLVFGPPGTGKTWYLANEVISKLIHESEKCRILVLTPTNQACDVVAKKLIENNSDYEDWLGRFVATNDIQLEQSDIVWSRDSVMYKRDKCCVISTMARLPYDYFEDDNGNSEHLKDIKWDCVICDEGSMISLPEIVYTIYKFSFDEERNFTDVPIYIAGDPKQLQPIDASNVWGGKNIYSMIQLESFGTPTNTQSLDVIMLKQQRRSVPAIGELYSRYSYNGLLEHCKDTKEDIVLNMPKLPLKPITYLSFKVDNFDDIFGPKRMSGSNVHIYSAIISSELCRYIANEYSNSDNIKKLKIGIICPYAAQAYLIDKLLSRYDCMQSELVEVVSGTIHSFQGDQCNVVIALFNPPKGMASKHQNQFDMLLNDRNLVNVAISRAMDYLIMMVPSKDSFGRENLINVNQVGRIIANEFPYGKSVIHIQSGQIEKLVFGSGNYLKDNSFVTSHQLANVYETKQDCVYDIRIDDDAIDIQIKNFDRSNDE